MLRYYKLCRTPQEELKCRFADAETVSLPDTCFAKNLQWMFQCCLRSHPDTKDMTLEYVREEGLGIDVLINGSILKISDRFLTYDASHSINTCGDPEPSDTSPFCCDHLILELWDNITWQLPVTPESQANMKDELRTKSLVAKRLSQIPRLVKCMQTSRQGELLVSWESNESARQSEQPVMAVLHKSACTQFGTTSVSEDREEGGRCSS